MDLNTIKHIPKDAGFRTLYTNFLLASENHREFPMKTPQVVQDVAKQLRDLVHSSGLDDGVKGTLLEEINTAEYDLLNLLEAKL